MLRFGVLVLTHPPAAVLQQQVNVAAVGEVPVEADDVPVAQAAVQLLLPLHLHRHKPGSPPLQGTLWMWGPTACTLGETGMGTHPATREGGRKVKGRALGDLRGYHPHLPGDFLCVPQTHPLRDAHHGKPDSWDDLCSVDPAAGHLCQLVAVPEGALQR